MEAPDTRDMPMDELRGRVDHACSFFDKLRAVASLMFTARLPETPDPPEVPSEAEVPRVARAPVIEVELSAGERVRLAEAVLDAVLARPEDADFWQINAAIHAGADVTFLVVPGYRAITPEERAKIEAYRAMNVDREQLREVVEELKQPFPRPSDSAPERLEMLMQRTVESFERSELMHRVTEAVNAFIVEMRRVEVEVFGPLRRALGRNPEGSN